MKWVSIFQNIFGITAVISFIAIFICLIINKNYVIYFASIFFLFFSLSLYFNKFSRGLHISKGFYFLIIIFFIFGLISSYYAFKYGGYNSEYEIRLEKNGNIFFGSFNMPKEVNLTNQSHIFSLAVSSYLSNSLFDREYLLMLKTPDKETNSSFSLACDKGTFCTQTVIPNFSFIPSEGDFIIQIVPKDKSGSTKINSVKVKVMSK